MWKWSSKDALTLWQFLITTSAHSTYSLHLFSSHLGEQSFITSVTFDILSAILTKVASFDKLWAWSTCSCFLSEYVNCLLSVSSSTMLRTREPNSFSISSIVASVSSTVSCNKAADKISLSSIPPISTRIIATEIGWIIYGVLPSFFFLIFMF